MYHARAFADMSDDPMLESEEEEVAAEEKRNPFLRRINTLKRVIGEMVDKLMDGDGEEYIRVCETRVVELT